LRGFHLSELHTNAKGRRRFGDYAVQDHSFDPNLPTAYPESNLYFGARVDRRHGLDEAASQAGVGQISPNGSSYASHMYLNCHEAFHARILPPVLSPGRRKNVGLEGRRCWRRQRSWHSYCGSWFCWISDDLTGTLGSLVTILDGFIGSLSP